MPEAAMDRLLGQGRRPPSEASALQHELLHLCPVARRCREHRAEPRVLHQRLFPRPRAASSSVVKFADQIEKLDASNRLFTIVKAMTDVDLHPDRIDNLQMGYLFEHLVMRFNEQANEEAGDHFTPREVIRLMAHLIYTGERDVYRPGIYRTIYDPACGTGGMLSESEKLILGLEPAGKSRPVRTRVQRRVLGNLLLGHAHQGRGHGQHRPCRYPR